MLSDAGLYDMADHLGSEWRHLAAVLGVTKAQQEHLIHNYPSNTKQQIYEMLRLWRDRIASGEKEQVGDMHMPTYAHRYVHVCSHAC